jgi:hypothetical protein
MNIFYWVMGGLIVATLIPSAMYVVLYAVTGEEGCIRRARILWNTSRVLALVVFNIGVWGHVAVAIWRIWFP